MKDHQLDNEVKQLHKMMHQFVIELENLSTVTNKLNNTVQYIKTLIHPSQSFKVEISGDESYMHYLHDENLSDVFVCEDGKLTREGDSGEISHQS